MRAIIQRVTNASVEVDGKAVSAIAKGLLIFVGIEHSDDEAQADWLASKISRLRIFNDVSGVMNESVTDQTLEILVVSQFTLHASTKKGNRPSYIRSARPEQAEPLYEYFADQVHRVSGCAVKKGVFGADMQIELTNSGPVTIFIDSQNPE